MTSIPKLDRLSYSILSSLIFGIVFLAVYLIATAAISFSPKFVALAGLAVQLLIVQRREADISPRAYWRICYSGLVGVICASFIDFVRFSPSLYEDVIRRESQAILGGFLLFNLLILPVHISCVARKSAVASS